MIEEHARDLVAVVVEPSVQAAGGMLLAAEEGLAQLAAA
jgi:adenosylmethionine-8-amino-7-oxononanoate aminotransferase